MLRFITASLWKDNHFEFDKKGSFGILSGHLNELPLQGGLGLSSTTWWLKSQCSSISRRQAGRQKRAIAAKRLRSITASLCKCMYVCMYARMYVSRAIAWTRLEDVQNSGRSRWLPGRTCHRRTRRPGHPSSEWYSGEGETPPCTMGQMSRMQNQEAGSSRLRGRIRAHAPNSRRETMSTWPVPLTPRKSRSSSKYADFFFLGEPCVQFVCFSRSLATRRCSEGTGGRASFQVDLPQGEYKS